MYKNITKILLTTLFIGCYHIAAALISIASVKGSACPGATGEVQFIIKGSAGPFNYSILNAAGTAIKSGTVDTNFTNLIKVTDLAKGSYKLVVNNTDYGGCTKTLDFKIDCCTSPPAAIVVNGTVANPTLSTGSITLEGLTAANTFFLWTKTGDPSFKATTKDLSGLASGEYCVKVTNGTCSEGIKCFTVGNCPATLIKSLSVVGICAAGFSDGNAKVIAENGQTPYKYKWSNGVTDAQVFGLAKGTYEVIVSDARNCMTVQSFGIKDRIGAITPTAQNGCGDEKGSISLAVEAQANNLTYQWQGENTGFSATTKNISNLNTDRYRVTVSSGCPRPYVSDWVSITNSALDVTVSTYPKSASIGGSVTIQLAGAAPLSYSFDSQPFVQGTFGTIGNLAGGTYSLVVRNGAGCTKQLNVTIYDCDNLETEKVFEIFPEITAQCPFTVKYDYKGKDMKGFKKQIIPHTVTLVPHKNGIDKVAKITQSACIKLTVEDAFCGKPSGTVLAEKCVAPTCDFETSNTHITCTDKTLTVFTVQSANTCNPLSYEWSHSNANTPSVPFTISPGNAKVSVTVTDANGCARVKFFDFDPLEGSVVANLCEGEGKACIAFNTTYKSSQLYKFTYQSTTTFDPNICNLAAGRHTVTVTDGNNCTYVKVFDVPSAKGKLEVIYNVRPAQTNTSHNGTINFNIVSGLPNYTYTLSNFKDFTKTESNISGTSHSAAGLSAGTYYLMIKDANDCSKTYVIELYYCEFEIPNITKEFTVRPFVEVKDYLCTNSILNASFNFNAQNKNITATVQGAPLINCSFYGTGTLPINRQLSQSNATIVFSNITNGQYHFQATEQNGCNRFYFLEIKDITVSTTIVDINDVFWKPEATIKHINAFCKEGSITLKPYVAGFNKTVTYLWKYPDNTTSNKKDLTNLIASGDYKLTITDPDCGKITEHTFKLNETPNQELKYTVENICSASGKGCVTFEISPFAAYAPFVFEWKKGNTAFPKSSSPKICNLDAGTYTFLIWNKDSCVVTKTIEVKKSNLVLSADIKVNNAANCSSNGSLIVQNITTTGGTAPFIYQWYKGDVKIPSLSSLSPGTYILEAIDAGGCSARKSFTIGVDTDISLHYSEIKQPCPSATNGQLTVTAKPTIQGGSYTYTWSGAGATTNTITGDKVTLTNLRTGFYTFTVSPSGNNNCKKIATYELKAATADLSTISITKTSPCKNSTNGIIKLTTTAQGYSVLWSDPIAPSIKNSWTQLGLAANNYVVTITNHCGQSETMPVELIPVGDYSVTETTDTKCRTKLVENFPNANPPLKYRWGNGISTNSIDSIPVPGNTFAFTVTDANSCTGTASVSDVQTWNVTTNFACAGANGSYEINVHNPKNLPIKVSNGIDLPLTPRNTTNNPNAHHWFSTGFITNTAAGVQIPIEITIGTCKGIDYIELPPLESTKKFVGDSVGKKKCDYIEECRGVCIKDATGKCIVFEDPGTYDVVNCQGIFKCPNLEGTKAPEFYKFKSGNDFWVNNITYGDYIAFLREEIALKPHLKTNLERVINTVIIDLGHEYGAYLAELKRDSLDLFDCNQLTDSQEREECIEAINLFPPRRPQGLCTKGSYCPVNHLWEFAPYDIKINFTVIFKPSDLPKKEGDKWIYYCGNLVKESNPTNSKDSIPPVKGVVINNCNPTKQSVLQLKVWYDDLLTKTEFIGTELHQFLEANYNNPKTNCVTIEYCKSSFKIITPPDFSGIECDAVHCNPVDFHGQNTVQFICKKNGREYIVSANANGTYAPRSLPSVKPSMILPANTSTSFHDFAFIRSSDSIYWTNGIFRADSTYYYQNFIPYANYNELNTIVNTTKIIKDIEIPKSISLTEIVENRLYAINISQGDLGFWSQQIDADTLKILKIKSNNANYIVAGYFRGDLYYNFAKIKHSSDFSAFTLTIDLQGNILNHTFVEGIDRNSIDFSDATNDYCLVAKSKKNVIKINDISTTLNYQMALINVNMTTGGMLNSLGLNENVQIIKAARDIQKVETYCIVSKKNKQGTDAQIGNILIKDNETYLLAIDASNKIRWSKKIVINDINTDFIDLIHNQDALYLSATFNKSIQFDSKTVDSKGGNDIFICKLSTNGEVKGYKHFGTQDDESVKKIYKYKGYIVLGGNINGTITEREIGDLNLIYLNHNHQVGFMSYFREHQFKYPKSSISQKIKSNFKQNINNFAVSVIPNPFNESLIINIDCMEKCNFEVKMYDILGRIKWQSKESTQTRYELDFAGNLEKGIYFLEVKGDNGNYYIKKVIKQ